MSQQDCLEGSAYFTRGQITFLFLGEKKKKIKWVGNVCIALDRVRYALSGWKEAGRVQDILTCSGSPRPAPSACLEMHHFLQQLAKLLCRPLPQQISVNQSSCRRSGRRRSVISLEPGGVGPPATARSQLHSCSVF